MKFFINKMIKCAGFNDIKTDLSSILFLFKQNLKIDRVG